MQSATSGATLSHCEFDALVAAFKSKILANQVVSSGAAIFVDLNDDFCSLPLLFAALESNFPFITSYSLDATLDWSLSCGISLITFGGDQKSGVQLSTSTQRHSLHNQACIYLSSGTTSSFRKGILHSHAALDFVDQLIIDNTNMHQLTSISEIIASPADNQFWFGRVRTIRKLKGRVVLLGKNINPLKVASILRQDPSINSLSGDVPIFNMLFREMQSSQWLEQTSGLKYIKMSSMKPSQDLVDSLLRALPNAAIYAGYGLTEAMRISINPIHITKSASHVGSVCPEWDVKLHEVDSKGIGTILVKGPGLASGYLNAPNKWNERVDENGFFDTGDLGSLTNGYLYFHGRKDHVINIGGMSIHPEHIESYIFEKLGVHSIISSVSSSVYGQTLVIVLLQRNDLEVWNSSKHLLQDLDSKMLPTQAIYLPNPPRTSTGKVRRSALALEICDKI